jgi:anthranilate phosphoribosyltransferase
MAESASIKGGSPAENAVILRSVLSGERGPRRDIVLLNTAAALVVGDRVSNLGEGVLAAAGIIDSGKALNKLELLISFTRSLT